MDIEFVEKLSLHEQFRLVEIAYETLEPEVREAALAVLKNYLHPIVVLSGVPHAAPQI